MIIPVREEPDEQGYWTHPALVRRCCHTTTELMYWLRVQKLECFVMTMRDEATDASTWELIPLPGEGWFPGSVHPREDGPECYWFRQCAQK